MGNTGGGGGGRQDLVSSHQATQQRLERSQRLSETSAGGHRTQVLETKFPDFRPPTPDETVEGIRFPPNVLTHAAVANVLTQEAGKLKIRDLKKAIDEAKAKAEKEAAEEKKRAETGREAAEKDAAEAVRKAAEKKAVAEKNPANRESVPKRPPDAFCNHIGQSSRVVSVANKSNEIVSKMNGSIVRKSSYHPSSGPKAILAATISGRDKNSPS